MSEIEITDTEATELETIETEPSFGVIVAQTVVLTAVTITTTVVAMIGMGAIAGAIEDFNDRRRQKKLDKDAKVEDVETDTEDTN